MPESSCKEYARTRRARAGDGLPTIEPGQPAPAGTGLRRRTVLVGAGGAIASVFGASRLLPNLPSADATTTRGAGRVLVSVYLGGGLDALAALGPTHDHRYRKARPTLRVAPDQTLRFSEDPRLQWHPALRPLARLHREGKVTVIPAIGWRHPDYSHFTSQHFWEVGAAATGAGTGWLGRVLDRHGDAENPLQGLTLGGELSPVLATERVPVSAVYLPNELSLDLRDIDDRRAQHTARSALRTLGEIGGDDAAIASVVAAGRQTSSLIDALEPLQGHDLGARYPGGGDAKPLPRQLAALAAMVDHGYPLRCVALTGAEGFDTHENEGETFGRDLAFVARSLAAFQRDLERRGIADRVLTLVWSEFGRRVAENGGGTDHGDAGHAFVIGSRASGIMVGEFPGLGKLDAEGNLRVVTEVRSVYASLCEQWLEVDAGGVIDGADALPRPALVRSA